MNTSDTTALSIHYLSWINAELRKKVELLDTPEQVPKFASTLKTYLVVVGSGLALVVMKFLEI